MSATATPRPRDVVITDVPQTWVRRPANAVGMVAAALGIACVLLLATYAQGTTGGMADDIHSFARALGRILVIPVSVLEAVLVIGAPLAILIELLVRRLFRQAIDAAVAALLGLGLALGTAALLNALGTSELIRSLSVVAVGPTTPAAIAAVLALLIVAGPRARRRSVRWSGNLLTVIVLVVLITGDIGLPGAFLALLLGVFAGLTVRLVSGERSERAYGDDLVAAIRRAGFDPISLTRIDGPDTARRYLMRGVNGEFDVLVLDGDRQVLGLMDRWWQAARLRGMATGAGLSLRAVADRNALLLYAATAAGVRTTRLLRTAMAANSAILVVEHSAATPLREVAASEGAAIAEDAWRQLAAAHRAGLAHRQLTKDAVLVEDGRVWIVDWQYGETNASQLSRRLDLTQMLTLLALRIGVQPAVTSAVQMLPRAEIEAIGPLLQSAALPPETRAEVRRNKGFLGELRQAFAAELPEAQTEPAQIARFSPRSLVMLALTIVAVVVVVTTINFEQIAAAVRAANPWWIAVSFILAALPWLGAAMPLVAFAPGRLPLLPAVEVQVASSFVALAAPVGIGPAGVNLRFLNRRGIATPVALATITLVQLMQVAVSVALLAALLLIEGPDGMIAAPSATVRIAIVAMFALVAVLLLVPPVRRFAWAKARPTLVQVWPRLLATVGQPKRLALGLSGNLIHALAYVFSFYAVLLAFNHTLPLVDVAIIYLVGNTVGALAPTPGGLGGVEGALIAGLSAAGIPAAIAMSVTMLFRVVSYWIQAPIGWVAMRHAQHTGDL